MYMLDFYKTPNFYIDVDNVEEIVTILKEYKVEEIAKDKEWFSEMYLELVEEYPRVLHLELVLERILVSII